MPNKPKCPSCHSAMTPQRLASVAGGEVELDLCFACRGIWFDPLENLKLTPAALVTLFRLLHDHRNDAVSPLAHRLTCPRCRKPLGQGFDVVKSGRYITYRCTQRHGRFSTFASFMIEKGFVRQLSGQEIDDMARRVGVINCSSCGAPVDLRKDHACPHCRSALSLLDPQAVEQALKGYAVAVQQTGQLSIPDLADALVMVERDRVKAEREAKAQRGSLFTTAEGQSRADLWAAGVALVWQILN
ncbi:MAG: zf-TFIIB domain-containing protein [Rhodoferax sp.]|nr:zf-TFIIB domain-containing protein [Rhodoferax sp.]MBP9147401.1 zf-TFIIB domain-containing protein [Rhodoferax sp.]